MYVLGRRLHLAAFVACEFGHLPMLKNIDNIVILINYCIIFPHIFTQYTLLSIFQGG